MGEKAKAGRYFGVEEVWGLRGKVNWSTDPVQICRLSHPQMGSVNRHLEAKFIPLRFACLTVLDQKKEILMVVLLSY